MDNILITKNKNFIDKDFVFNILSNQYWSSAYTKEQVYDFVINDEILKDMRGFLGTKDAQELYKKIRF